MSCACQLVIKENDDDDDDDDDDDAQSINPVATETVGPHTRTGRSDTPVAKRVVLRGRWWEGSVKEHR